MMRDGYFVQPVKTMGLQLLEMAVSHWYACDCKIKAREVRTL
jgi:hypothetical protein